MTLTPGATVAVEYDNSLIVGHDPIKRRTTRERITGTIADTSTEERIVINADNFDGAFIVNPDKTVDYEHPSRSPYEVGTEASIETV